jgi:nucleoside-diphosphate-sugar epimerase
MSLKSKVLLTGATGFLGKEILKILNDSRDLEIITLSRKKASISIDLSEKAPAFNVGFSLVIHCAGKAHVAPSKISNQKDIFSVNVNGTLNLIRGLEVAPNLPERFVFISSVSVYGLTSGQLINEKNELIFLIEKMKISELLKESREEKTAYAKFQTIQVPDTVRALQRLGLRG